jgi:hypothetical protein
MCGIKTPVKELIEALGDGTDLSKLREAADGCPACMLAAIRQSGLQYADEEGGNYIDAFNYKEEKAAWWAHVNEQRWQELY